MSKLKVLSSVAAIALTMAVAAPTASFAQGHGWHGGGWHGGGWGGGGFIPGAVAGAIIGGAIATAPYGYGYYGGGPGYYAPGYYGQGYDEGYDGPVVAGPQAGGGDDVAYCMQTYRSYNPRTGTYLGYDGYRHACP